MSRAVTRIGDADLPHCGATVRAEASPDVVVNDMYVSRQGDLNVIHLVPSGSTCGHHTAPIALGSTTVIVNDRGIGRVGDHIAGCTYVAEGSPDTIAG